MIRVAKSVAVLSLALFASGCIVDDNDCYDCGAYHDPDPCVGCNDVPPAPVYERISMFASGAVASSEGVPGDSDFSASQALGAPNATCGDDPAAWSPYAAEPYPGTAAIDDWLEVTFSEFVWVSQVRIFENFNPGAIVAVDLEASDGLSSPVVLFEDFGGNGVAPCGAFNITVNDGTTMEQFDRVVIYFDTNLIGDANRNGNWHDDFNEVDAVELIGDVQVF